LNYGWLSIDYGCVISLSYISNGVKDGGSCWWHGGTMIMDYWGGLDCKIDGNSW